MYSIDHKPPAPINNLLYRIRAQSLRSYPFCHFYGDGAFDPTISEKIRMFWPKKEELRAISATGRVKKGEYEQRSMVSLDAYAASLPPNCPEGNFWRQMNETLNSDELIAGALEWLWPTIKAVRELPEEIVVFSDVILTEDEEGYAIGPHTDAPNRLVTILFYVPTDAKAASAGTSLFAPRDMNFDSKISGVHHDRSLFDKVFTVPFLPDSFLGFIVSPNSYHGVDEVGLLPTSRRQIQYSIRYRLRDDPQ